MNILVTGSNGFVGSAIVRNLKSQGHSINAAVRCLSGKDDLPETIAVGNIDSKTDWRAAVTGQAVVIHAAARVHVMTDNSSDPLSEFRKVNRDGTKNLAEQAAGAGVRRFIFISTIKVNGEQTLPGQPYTENDGTNPIDAYSVSKLEAEESIIKVCEKTGMEYTILRPPMIYGPGVKGNFLSMMRWIHFGVPLPFGAVRNMRSMIALRNFISLISICMEKPMAANQIFLAGDGRDLSTSELLQSVGEALGKPARLFSFPERLIEIAASFCGQQKSVKRLLGTLQVSIKKANDLLSWFPPVSVKEGLRETDYAYFPNKKEKLK